MNQFFKITVLAQGVVLILSIQGHAFDVNSKKQMIEGEKNLIQMAIDDAVVYRSEERLNANLKALALSQSALGFDTYPDESFHRIIAAVDGEHWSEFRSHKYDWWRSLFRCQGVTNDDHGNWWYSGTVSLLRLKSRFAFLPEASVLFPLPSALSHQGDNHIGDIDVDTENGDLYVPIEDGPKYQHPYIGVYDAHSLKVKRYVELPQAQQADGVPWVAVEPSTKRVFSSQYYNAPWINVYDQETLQPAGHIAMSQIVNEIQGAKVVGGMMYMTADGNPPGPRAHSVYKLNLATGTVMEVAQFPHEVNEIEGITFWHDDKGKQVMSSEGWFNGVLFRRIEMMDYGKDGPSLRDQFRARIGIVTLGSL